MAIGVEPLIVPQKELSSFFAGIGPAVRRAFELPEHRYLLCQKYEAMGERATETYRLLDSSEHAAKVIDLRGNEIDAVKLLSSQSETIFASLSFEWAKAGRRFRFSGAQFVVFVGNIGKGSAEEDVRQLFRLEWQGRLEDGTFEAAVAGHPHWQVDATPIRKVAAPAPVAAADLSDLLQKREPPRKTWMNRIHLPCSANDWAVGTGWTGDPSDCAAHTSSPQSLSTLATWVISASRYLRHQIGAAVAA